MANFIFIDTYYLVWLGFTVCFDSLQTQIRQLNLQANLWIDSRVEGISLIEYGKIQRGSCFDDVIVPTRSVRSRHKAWASLARIHQNSRFFQVRFNRWEKYGDFFSCTVFLIFENLFLEPNSQNLFFYQDNNVLFSGAESWKNLGVPVL